MKIIRKSSENEMLLEYLKSEIDSSRFGERLKKTLDELNLSTDIILNANLENQEENNQRKLIMEKFRWYPTDDIFKNFPKEIKWYFVEFEEGDFDKIFYLDWFSWNDISNNTSKPIEAAENIRKGIKYYDIQTERFYEGLEYLEKGGKFNPIIAITCNEEKIALIEGHYRVTVYAMKPELFTGTFGYVGFCSKEEMEKYNSKMV
jgi:hypothetical protein